MTDTALGTAPSSTRMLRAQTPVSATHDGTGTIRAECVRQVGPPADRLEGVRVAAREERHAGGVQRGDDPAAGAAPLLVDLDARRGRAAPGGEFGEQVGGHVVLAEAELRQQAEGV